MAGVSIPEGYAWVMLTGLAMLIQCMSEGLKVFHLRAKYFNPKFMAENFPDLKEVPVGGYPDMGHGRFADKLTLNDWMDFCNNQRIHHNYLELVPIYLFGLLSGGLFYPQVSVVAGCMLMVARRIYGNRYRTAGPNARHIGTLLDRLCALVMLGTTIIGCWNAGGGFTGLRIFFGF